MKNKSLQSGFLKLMMVALIGFVFIGLTGCGIGHGSYRHGYNQQNVPSNADNYHQGHVHSANDTADSHDTGNRGNGYMRGYSHDKNGNCSW